MQNLKKKYNGKYFDVLENIRNASEIFENSDNIELGCYITFNDFWIKPYYKENLDNNYRYEGVEIGFWDTAFKQLILLGLYLLLKQYLKCLLIHHY